MNFSDRIVRLPRAFEPERGDEAVAALGLGAGPLADLVSGTAGSSPFLCAAILHDVAWSAELLEVGPDAMNDQVMAATAALEDRAVEVGLRTAKRQIAVLTALADLGGIWSLEDVTGALTSFADLATDRALKAALAPEIKRGKLPEMTEADLASGAGLVVLAMGKMGAGELNYSSDIDLILLYDDARFAHDAHGEARAAYVRAARKATRLLSDRTGDGYVFRTDLRLRPDASVTPVVLSMEAAERYYESLGRTWERAAYIKARPAACDLGAGARFLEALRPFVWRRHLDFAAIRDAHDIRQRIRESKGLHAAPSHLGHDLKLGKGGIREIEFFTQTRQLIAGGRDPSLRLRGTVESLDALAKADWISEPDARQLSHDYRALRETEHRVQMVADQQTHKLPVNEDEFRRLACLSGVDEGTLKRDLLDRFERVSHLTDAFFEPGAPRPSSDGPELTPAMEEIIARWPSYPALRSDRAREIFKRMRPALLTRICASDRPEQSLGHFDGFLSGLPAGVQLFSLFEANPQLLDLVIDITGTAPGLARYLARNPQVFDAVIGGAFFTDWPGASALKDLLSRELAALEDYEQQLDAARRWAKEWTFRVGVHVLRGLIDADIAGRQYAEVADAVLSALWPVVVGEFAAKHGAPPGRGATVLGMGSLGAAQLGPASDLDLIVIYDPLHEEASTGRRPLATRAYYARLTQALVTALSAPMSEGRLYEVDMRLRPSGRQGPVATSLQAFCDYQTNEAWTWEHLALTRARVIAGSPEIGADLDAFRAKLLKRSRERTTILRDVAEMRKRLSDAKGARGRFEAKQGPGRLMDLELVVETGALLAGSASRRLMHQIPVACDSLDLAQQQLVDAAMLYRRVAIALALISDKAAPGSDLDAGSGAFLARFAGCNDAEDVANALDRTASDLEKRFDQLFDPDGTR